MKKLLAFVLSFAAAGASFAAQPLLTPAELKARLGDPNVRVIDIRDAKSYGAQHIPGAVNAPYGKWRGPAGNPGELPELPKLTRLVQSLGLTPATHAVVVSSGADATDFGASARVYWTLKVLGLKELSILNGGVKAWAQAQLPQDAKPVQVAASSYAPALDQSLIATREEVAQKAETGGAVFRFIDLAGAEAVQQRAQDPAHMGVIVDDEETIRLALGRFLRSRGYEVDLAPSGEVAVQLLDASKYAVMLCDLRMPDLSGLDVLQRMRADERTQLVPELPTIAEVVPGYEFIGWYGLVAPAKTPPAARAASLSRSTTPPSPPTRRSSASCSARAKRMWQVSPFTALRPNTRRRRE